VTSAVLLTDSADPAVARAATLLPACRLEVRPTDELAGAMDAIPNVRAVIVATENPVALRAVVDKARLRRIPVIVACRDEIARRRAVELRADEWYRVPASPDEIEWRVRSASSRVAAAGIAAADRVERVEYEEMLYDTLTGMPTLPVMIERTRERFKERRELIVFYLSFVRYAKIEEIYGWEKLDEVLETTAEAVREFLDQNAFRSMRMMVGFTNDDDFIFFHIPAAGTLVFPDQEITQITKRLQQFVAVRLEEAHGEDIAALFDIYVGSAHVYYNPKVRLERLIYRGIREAANAARSIEERERARKAADLRRVLHDRSVYIEYHPIIAAETGRIFGYEALARGTLRSLRSPEAMFEVAADADLLWELSRLCRERALEGMNDQLRDDQLLFLNVDPHDFADPTFNELHNVDPRRVVIEITERTAIKDYHKFRERLRAFRERGFRFAVDDAGSGYAGLGTIANLEPDFIKLDISLINSIDTNFIKQNLVETMVGFAREQGAMVIAEGIERAEELETVKRLGVPLVQGFFLHQPERERGERGEVELRVQPAEDRLHANAEATGAASRRDPARRDHPEP
jgi:EAL domain-containing protein (putative c-di-GMP-specific phosphodiesterase class I)/GGDEF domain-containing protein